VLDGLLQQPASGVLLIFESNKKVGNSPVIIDE
jgi:hypothetical protein